MNGQQQGQKEKGKLLPCRVPNNQRGRVQIMHMGVYDSEPEAISQMDNYLIENGYQNDMSGPRLHHEIYCLTHERLFLKKGKAIIKHPIKMK